MIETENEIRAVIYNLPLPEDPLTEGNIRQAILTYPHDSTVTIFGQGVRTVWFVREPPSIDEPRR